MVDAVFGGRWIGRRARRRNLACCCLDHGTLHDGSHPTLIGRLNMGSCCGGMGATLGHHVCWVPHLCGDGGARLASAILFVCAFDISESVVRLSTASCSCAAAAAADLQMPVIGGMRAAVGAVLAVLFPGLGLQQIPGVLGGFLACTHHWTRVR